MYSILCSVNFILCSCWSLTVCWTLAEDNKLYVHKPIRCKCSHHNKCNKTTKRVKESVKSSLYVPIKPTKRRGSIRQKFGHTFPVKGMRRFITSYNNDKMNNSKINDNNDSLLIDHRPFSRVRKVKTIKGHKRHWKQENEAEKFN